MYLIVVKKKKDTLLLDMLLLGKYIEKNVLKLYQ